MEMLSSFHSQTKAFPWKLMQRRCRINSAHEIKLPQLRCPNQKPIKPLKTTSTVNISWIKKLNNKTKITTTTTDILRLFDSLSLPVPPDLYTCLIKECTIKKNPSTALDLHAHIKNTNFRPTLVFLNRLLLMLVSCGQLCIARQLFDQMPVKDLYSWAVIILGYIDVADYQESITLFVNMMMQQQQLCTTSHLLLEFPSWIIVCLLKACVCTFNMELGKQVHGLLLKLGSSSDISFMGSLISFYGKFGCLEDANFVFNQLLHHNTVIWTAKIVNNCREGHFDDVLRDFIEMGRKEIKKNSFTFSSVLKACAGLDDDGNCGRQVHASAIKMGLESNDYVQCGLVDMYGKCGLLRDAKRVFGMISNKKNIACWNAMLVGYVKNGSCVEAVKFLYQMKAAGIEVQESLIEDVRIICGSLDRETKEAVMIHT
ncbi:hypothetical protein LWI28_022860 [Acer negundo]|uniref:Pentatricopeptide repeat-containing protein n=1 Tax=Acer negundo TaxID=4023 RepID=A0AAD5NFH3_ACENE|nr:hypothetical protein LWI28_022860 [Acer negundo]KAK4833886.1 hypothetical protein QYF36_012866 [Acer negundo]